MFFDIVKKIVLTTSIMILCSGSFDAFGSTSSEEDSNSAPRKALVPAGYSQTDDVSQETGKALVSVNTQVPNETLINFFSPELLRLIFVSASEHTNPCYLMAVRKGWLDSICQPNNFLQTCRTIFKINNPLYDTLIDYEPDHDKTRYVDKQYRTKQNWCPLDETRVISDIVLTPHMNRFFKVKEENAHKIVCFFSSSPRMEQPAKEMPNEPFKALLEDLNEKKEHAVLCWRRGNDTDITNFRFKFVMFSDLSSVTLFEHWKTAQNVKKPNKGSLNRASASVWTGYGHATSTSDEEMKQYKITFDPLQELKVKGVAK